MACGKRPFFIIILALLLASCGQSQTYQETFDEPGDWRVASDSNVSGIIENGVYDFLVLADQLTFWTTASENFSDGAFQVDATQIDGPIDNGYGMIFRVDDAGDNFYSFQISGDGYVWIGRYRNGVAENAAMINDWWFPSAAIQQGLDNTNTLRVEAESQNMIFYVNGSEVGRISDAAFDRGDIGLLVMTLGAGGVHVEFDNFIVEPLGS